MKFIHNSPYFGKLYNNQTADTVKIQVNVHNMLNQYICQSVQLYVGLSFKEINCFIIKPLKHLMYSHCLIPVFKMSLVLQVLMLMALSAYCSDDGRGSVFRHVYYGFHFLIQFQRFYLGLQHLCHLITCH